MKYKYLGTSHCFSGIELKIIRKMLSCEKETHGQFRVVCKARGIEHANELTKDIGRKVFRREYTSETGNDLELSMFENNKNVNYIIGYIYSDTYLTNIQLNKIIELIEENKGERR